jgi:hypothetical protein
MPVQNEHVDHPDVGIISTDLFIYHPDERGTGGAVAITVPAVLAERPTLFIRSTELEIWFVLNRAQNTGQVLLKRRGNTEDTDRKTFHLAPDFFTQSKVSLNLLFSDWKIVALIDGEPLDEL